MKKILLMTVMFFMTMAVVAQTYTNLRQSSNNKRLKVVKVERSSDATIVYLKYTIPEGSTGWSRIEAYPTLTDEATGKRYQATDALNFKWGKTYTKTATYKVEFPPLPRTTSVVTFKEASSVKKPFIISNIALPIQSKQTTTNKSAANNSSTNKPKVYDKKKLLAEGYKFSWDEPKQSINNRDFKVTKVIRSNENTIVHLRYNGQDRISTSTHELGLIDYDTEKQWNAKRGLNFNLGQYYSGPCTFKIEYPAIPLSVTTLAIKNGSKTVVENIKVPIRAK